MNAGDGLHDGTVAIGQAHAVPVFQLSDVAAAVLRNGDGVSILNERRHASGPQ